MFRSISLALLLSGLCAAPAMAGDRHRHRDFHHHHRPSISFGFYSNPYPYYAYDPFFFHPGPTVIYSRPRTVYVERDRSPSVERDVQTELARKGYYGGVIDGEIGPQTRAAIRAYQVDRGIPVTGRIDGALLRSLKLI